MRDFVTGDRMSYAVCISDCSMLNGFGMILTVLEASATVAVAGGNIFPGADFGLLRHWQRHRDGYLLRQRELRSQVDALADHSQSA